MEPPAAPATDEPRGSWSPGESFDGYVIEKVLGAGGMGFVYKARQTSLDRDVAIKTLLPEHATKAEYLTRFRREGRASTRIKSRHVVQVFDVRERGDMPYLVMEFLDGVSLEQHIETRGALSFTESVGIVLPVCDAVAAAHRVGVIHRDLKPANVFLTRGDDGATEPKVVDFGISRIQEDVQDGLRTKTRALLGTPAYLSPEQTHGAKHLSERSDQYALGVILYECVTGQHPFVEDDFFALIMRIARGNFAPPSTLRPDLDPALEAVILRAMATDPAARFDSVAALAAALVPFADRETALRWSTVFAAALPAQAVVPRAIPAASPPPSAAPRRLWVAGAAALGLLALVASVVVGLKLLGGRDPGPPAPDASVVSGTHRAPAIQPDAGARPTVAPPPDVAGTQPPTHPALRPSTPHTAPPTESGPGRHGHPRHFGGRHHHGASIR